MNDTEHLQAIEDIKQAKARYFRGVDTSDGALVRSVLADDCVLDYMGCCTDPKSGRDSVHHGHNGEVTLTSDTTASAIWPMTDRLYLPAGSPYAVMIGYGYYHETYEKHGGRWQIKTLRIQRLRVEAS